MQAFQFVAILTANFFSGAAIYVNVVGSGSLTQYHLVEHPAGMECGTELAASVFGPSYRGAAKMDAIVATAATISEIGRASWMLRSRGPWALLILAIVPFTIICDAGRRTTTRRDPET